MKQNHSSSIFFHKLITLFHFSPAGKKQAYLLRENSNCKLFLGLDLPSYIQAADDSKRTDSPA